MEHMPPTVVAERALLQQHLDGLAHEDPSRFELVNDLSEALPPMKRDCRLTLTVPAFKEGARIRRMLSAVLLGTSGQPDKQRTNIGDVLDPNTYEIVIFNDWAADERPDRTSAEIRSFMNDYPQAPVRLVSTPTPRQRMSVGYARMMAQDIVSLRSIQRPQQTGELFIGSDDADMDGFDPHGISTYIGYLDTHPHVAGASMRNERNPLLLRQVPHLFLRYRASRMAFALLSGPEYQDVCRESQTTCSRYPMAHGIGLVYRASQQIGAGGFRDNESAEDFDLWRRMFWQKTNGVQSGWRLPGLPTVVVSSPRRQLVSCIEGRDGYANGAFSALNETVRSDEQALVAAAVAAWQADPDAHRHRTEHQLNIVAARLREHRSEGDYAPVQTSMRRLLFALGFRTRDYVCLNDGSIRITDWEESEARTTAHQPSRRIQRSLA